MIQIDYKLKGKCGIYSILNLENGKRYIGSSVNLYNRLHEHWHNLKNNKSHNKHLQSAWNKYGEENFLFNILEFCEPETRFEREQYYMDFINPEYNFVANVVANLGRDISQEQKIKISNTLKKKYASGELIPYIRQDILKECWVYDIKNWKLAYKCKTYTEAAQKLQIDRDTISTEKIKNRIFKKQYIILRKPLKFVSELKNLFFKEYFTPVKFTKYLMTKDNNNNLCYYQSFESCSKICGCSSSTLRNHLNATINNPYITKNGIQFFISLEYIPYKETAVPIEKSSELLETKIMEGCDANHEVNSEIKESESPQRVEIEPINIE